MVCSGRGPSSWLVGSCHFIVSFHGAWKARRGKEVEGERERELLVSSYKGTNRIRSGSPLMASFNLNYLLRDPSPNIAPLGVRVSMYEFGCGVRGHNSVHRRDQREQNSSLVPNRW